MPSTFVPVGASVHVNYDDEDWGRIAHDGKVIDIDDDGCIVHFPNLGGGADVWVPYKSVNLRA